MVRDISERKQLDRLKNEFVAMVSHELRTPLTSIRGSLGLMDGGAAGELPAKARDLVRIASQNTERLIRLINDILDLEKIEAGKVELQLEPVAFPPLIEDLFVTMRPLADQRGCELTLVQCGELRTVISDPRRVRQVLLNLGGNAVKFTQEGEVSLALSVLTSAASQAPVPELG